MVDCFLVNVKGEADGLVLTDGTEIHFPPHLGRARARRRAAGHHGARPRGAAAWRGHDRRRLHCPGGGGTASSIAGPPDHDGEHARRHRKQAHTARTAMEAQGVVRQALHGPKGELRGLLLEDGRAGRFPPHVAASVAGVGHAGQADRAARRRLGQLRTAPSSRFGRSAPQLTICAVLETEKPQSEGKPDKKHKRRPHDAAAGEPHSIRSALDRNEPAPGALRHPASL